MKLLNTRTMQLEDFLDGNIPPYAILSHRWQKEELSFRDLKPKFASSLPSKPGYAKVYNFCKTASREGFDYGWVDTTCIDKRSSAELSEAINSMFRWYQDAATCYVYMDTVPSSTSSGEMDDVQIQSFRRSEWFIRGWTLQELLAPAYVIFLDCNWIEFGTKNSLAREISQITNIERRFLIDSSRLTLGCYIADPPCVATKMSWASMRTTSRKEDMAYCLLGIFDINMPLLYGEGEKAFQRLQEEIIRKTDDETIFAWRGVGTGFLAPSPRSFVNCQWIRPLKADHRPVRPPYSVTNRGLEFQGKLIEQKREVIERGSAKMSYLNLLPLRVSFSFSGPKVFCALAVSFSPDEVYGQTKHLRRADSTAIFECTLEIVPGPASSITSITRAAVSQMRMGDRAPLTKGADLCRQDVTNDYCLPTASDWTSKMRQLLYLSLNKPLGYVGTFGGPNSTAVSTAWSKSRYANRKRDVTDADSFGITAPKEDRSMDCARGENEHVQPGTSETIYTTPRKA